MFVGLDSARRLVEGKSAGEDVVGAELPTKLLLDREGWRWEQILPVGEGDVYCCGVHRGTWVSPLCPIMWCVQEALPLSLAQMLQLGPLWGHPTDSPGP